MSDPSAPSGLAGAGRRVGPGGPGASLDVAWAVACLGGGLVGGVLWRLLAAPVAGAFASSGEQRVASDGTLAGLLVLTGVLVAVVLAVAPGRRPIVRTGTALAASVLAGPLAWGVGAVLGAPRLGMPGVTLLQAATAAALVFVVTGIRVAMDR